MRDHRDYEEFMDRGLKLCILRTVIICLVLFGSKLIYDVFIR